MWMLEYPKVKNVTGAIYWKGSRKKETLKSTVEDFAEAGIELESGTMIKMASSWKISAGCNAVINWTFYGTNGTICIRNVNGSFYDFITEKYNGTSRIVLNKSPQNWGDMAIREWAKKVSRKNNFDSDIENVYQVASIIDTVYSCSN
jgi:predicted dehydrogenase